MKNVHFTKTIFFRILFLLSTLSWSSCNNSESGITEFPIINTLNTKAIDINNLMGMPTDVIIQGDYIVVLDLQTDKFLHVYAKDSYQYIGSLLRKGNGPDEEVEIAPYFMNYDHDYILFQSFNAIKTAKIEKQNDSVGLIDIKIYPLPDDFLNDTGFFKIDNKFYSSVSYRESSKDFFVFNFQSGETYQWGEKLPLTSRNTLNKNTIPVLNQKSVTYNNDNDLLACVFHMLPILRIYSAENGKLIKELNSADFSVNKEILLNDELNLREDELTSYYYRIKSTPEYIYALYAGNPVSDHNKDGIPDLVDFSNEIHVWKWDGTPVMRLKLDRSVFSFDVSKDNKMIIATSIVDVSNIFEAEIPWD